MLLEKYLIQHCAPTLANLKTASLFSLNIAPDALEEQLLIWNQQLQQKGLFLMLLTQLAGRSLVYVCRTSHLRKDLGQPQVAHFLSQYGYAGTDVDQALAHLRERLQEQSSFPHEIGVFLGYPLGDVMGFICNGGKNCKCEGPWKVYCNERQALHQFARLQKCREVYTKLWQQGRSIWQLTVAA